MRILWRVFTLNYKEVNIKNVTKPNFQRIERASIAFFEIKCFEIQLNLFAIRCIDYINTVFAGWITIWVVW